MSYGNKTLSATVRHKQQTNIYINDLFFINDNTDVCNYADDTTFYKCDKDINNLMKSLEHDSLLAIEWFDSNYMKLNESKRHFRCS